MITAIIKNGLGNQLFIYATARQLSIIQHQKLMLDLQFNKDSYGRKFTLDKFQIPRNILVQPEISRPRLLDQIKSTDLSPDYIVDDKFSPSELLNLNLKEKNIILDGDFQNYLYFENIRPTLIDEFQPCYQLSSKARSLLEIINQSNSVCVHARRLHGVKASEPAKPNQNISSLSLEYYLNGINQLQQSVKKTLTFFLFADYPNWYKESNLISALNLYQLIDENYLDIPDYEILFLMSRCKHFLIANSTFSWWGAWLSDFPGKIVISPKMSEWEPKLKVPDSWIQIADTPHKYLYWNIAEKFD